jgi:hypothetical protein
MWTVPVRIHIHATSRNTSHQAQPRIYLRIIIHSVSAEIHSEARVRPPILSPSQLRDWIKSGKHVSIFLDEFHKCGTHTDWTIGALHDLVDTIYQVRDSRHIRFCAATSLFRGEFIAQLGGSLYRRMEDICTIIEIGDGTGSSKARHVAC